MLVFEEQEEIAKIDRLFKYIQNKPLYFTYYVCMATGFLIRIIQAINAVGIYHPDEIFQSLEMAHLLVYGFGYKPPEFLMTNAVDPSYAMSRSWLFPWIFAILMWIGIFFSLNYYSGILPLIRISLAVNSILLVPVARKFVSQLSKQDSAGLLAGIFVSFWFRIIEIGVRPLTNSFFLPLLVYSMYRALVVLDRGKITVYDDFIFTLGFGLITYIRVDLGIYIFSLFVATFSFKHLSSYRNMLFDGVIGWFIGALVDMQYYHEFMVVPINWFTFNIVLHKSDIFGLASFGYYVAELIYLDRLTLLTVLSLLLYGFMYYQKRHPQKVKLSKEAQQLAKAYQILFHTTVLSWIILSSPWRLQSHKELRFAYGAVVLAMCLFPVVILLLGELMTNFGEYYFGHSPKYKSLPLRQIELSQYLRLFVIGLLLISFMSSNYIGFQTRYHREEFQDVNLALEYIHDHGNVTGVYILLPWYLTGAYTYLHTNVSITWLGADLSTNKLDLLSLQLILHNTQLGNYLIVPHYLYSVNPGLFPIIGESNFHILISIQGRSDVYMRPTTQ